METLRIGRLRTRYRLPRAATAVRQRLDRILADACGETLERALEHAGLRTHEEICIRHVSARVELRLSATDAALAAVWSLALVEAIRTAIDRGDPAVVRYGSRAQALVDLATGVALGDLARAWAWRKLELWPMGEPVGREATVQAVRALVEHPEMIVPVLSELARGDVFVAFARLLRAHDWSKLARAAVTAATGTGGELPMGEPQRGPRTDEVPDVEALEAQAERVLHGSRILQAVVRGSGMEGPARPAYALLALLEVEPTALRRGMARAWMLVHAVASALSGEHAAAAPGDAAGGHSTSPRVVGGAMRASLGHGPRRTEPATRGADEAATSDAVIEPARIAPPQDGPPAELPTGAASGAAHRRTLQTASAARDSRREGADARPVPTVRRRARTRTGGLLFLLHIVQDLGLPDEIFASPLVPTRSFRWVMHQLALALVPLDPSDPAALAFAGLRPDDDPPTRRAPPPTEVEREAVQSLAAWVGERLRELLERRNETAALVVHTVCRREAEIVSDPGWIEVHLSLEELSTEIRRIALDLDLGYLSWLGVVVRFVYA